jgi:hypothetical protein
MAWTTWVIQPYYWINGTPVYLVNGTHWVNGPDLVTGSGSYSIGGGAVAPVPQGPAVAVAVAAAEPQIKTYANCDVAAGECLAAFEAYQPPQYWHGRIARGERPVTSDTLGAAILRAIPSRTKKFRTEGLDVGLRWADTSGVTFTVEGLRVE